MTRRKRERKDGADRKDDRPPICPACGVTQGMVMSEDEKTTFVCLECGFTDEDQ